MSRDLNKAFVLKNEQRAPRWIVIDARGKILGRLATQIANSLRGKTLATYTPHTDSGDYVIVINAQDIVLTGNKWQGKIYDRYSGWMGGYKTETAQEVHKKDSTKLVKLAVKRMLPKSKLSRQVIEKLRVYAGNEHPHQAQVR
ncbi:MAG: 50S ribosomal protein L13 [Candidatus Babeliales bacterium]